MRVSCEENEHVIVLMHCVLVYGIYKCAPRIISSNKATTIKLLYEYLESHCPRIPSYTQSIQKSTAPATAPAVHRKVSKLPVKDKECGGIGCRNTRTLHVSCLRKRSHVCPHSARHEPQNTTPSISKDINVANTHSAWKFVQICPRLLKSTRLC